MKKHRGKSWVETDVEELLGLSAEDLVIVEFLAALAVALQRARKRKKMTQEETAEAIGTSQAQVSKMEAGQSSITIDRLIKALASVGVSPGGRSAAAVGPASPPATRRARAPSPT